MHAYKMTVAAVLCAGSAFADFTYQSTITPPAGESVTVEFPAGDYSHAEGMKIELPNTLKTSVRLYGPNTTWTMPDSDTAYPTYPFHVTQNGRDAVCLKPATALLKQSPLTFANFDVTTSFDKSKEALSTVFNGGTYNFYDPNGTPPTAMPEIYFDNKNGRNVQEVVFSGANTRLPKVLMTGATAAVTNRLVFSGGFYEVMGDLQTGNSPARWYEVFVTDSALQLNGEFCFGSSKASLLDVRDSMIVFGGTAQRYFGNTTYTPWTFRAVNSSVRFVPNWACMGFSSKDGNVGQVAMSNCVFVTDAVLQMNGDLSAEFVDCVVTNTHDYRVCNYDYTHGETTRIRYAGDKARSRIGGETRFGSNAKMLCDFEIAGGYHTFVSTDANWRMAEKSGGYLKFTVSGGTVDRDGKAFDFGYAAGATVDLYLTGGTVKASKIGKRTPGSTVNLVANDNVFQVAAAGTVVSGFDVAEIGEKGFTVDTNGKSVTIDQSFTGTGKLILTGGGSVTFAAGCTVAGGIEVRGGTKVVFNDEVVKGLTVGKDGSECVLSVACGTPLVVDGDLDVNAFKVEITGGTYEKSPDFRTIIRVTGNLVGETSAKWEEAVFMSGISADGALDLSIAESDDAKVLGFKVRDPIAVLIAVPDGEDVATNKTIKTCLGDTLVFDIGADGSFASDYPIRTGAILVKRGEGTLVLGNENNSFQSVTNEAGTIILRHPNALGGLNVPISGKGIVYDFAEPGETSSTFTVAKADANEAILVEVADKDVTMPLYDILNGGIVKDGPGAAAFLMPDKNVRLSVVNATPWKGNKNKDAGFTIRQGEVAFRGLTPTVRELTYSWANFNLGVDGPLTSERVSPPRLVFDHIKFSATATGIGFGKIVDGPSAGDASFFATNHADVSINGFVSGLNKTWTPSKESAYVKIDDHSSVSALYASYIYGDGCQSLVFDVDHESSLIFNTFDTRGNFEMNFRNGSSLKKYNSKGGLAITYGVATHLTRFRFESGSTCYVNKIGEQQADKTSPKSDCRMLFDDGEWNPLRDTFTFCFERITGELAVKGAGLVLAPTNTQVWTVGTPIVDSAEGAGGLIKRGEGTVILNAANRKYTGVTRLENGVLDLDGTEIEGLTVESVGGVFANGTLVKPTYRVAVDDDWQAATPAVIDPSLVSGRVTIDLGRTEANPLPLPYRSLAVATYTGDVAPDVSKWKATGTGISNTKVTLSVDPSTKTIVATPDQWDGIAFDTNGKDVTIDWSFTGEDKLILMGGGSVTFAAGCTVAGRIEVLEGTKVVFNDTLAPAGLTVGKDDTECVLSLPYGRTLSVNGDLDVGSFKIAIIGGTYEKSTDFYEIIRVTGELVGETAAKWEDVVCTSGVSPDGAFDVSIQTDGTDKVLGFMVRGPITMTITVPAGEDVVTKKTIKTYLGDTLVFDIGADGSFTSEYPVRTGAILVKRGEGTLVLGNENNNFQSVTNEAGTIVLKHPNALGGLSVPISGEGIVYDFAEPGEKASTFTVAKAQSNEAIRVEIANADVTMPLYDILNGGIVKDGPGAAAFLMPDKNVRLSIANATPWKGNKNGDAGFTIRQGEVAFRGRTPTVRELTYSWANFKLGVDGPLTSERVSPPRLVFDHIKFSATATGIGFGKIADGPSAGDASFFATNHADVSINGFVSGLNKTGTPSKESAYVKIDDHSSISALYASYIYGDGCQSLVFDVDHESVVALNSLDTRGNFEMNFRNGSVLRLQPRSGGGLHALPITYGVAPHLTKFRFESGSTCYVNKIGEQQADKTSLKSDCRMLFDDGEWNPLKDTFTFCFERITGELAVKGAGLVLAPTNTQVWTVGTPIVDSAEGAGGLVKRGEGTVVLNAANIRYTGATRIEGGVLDLDGSEVEGLTVESVGGAFANGTLVKPTYRVTVDDDWQAATPAMIDPSLVSGRVTIDLGRTEANPLPLPYRSLAVATYTGDVAPDVSKWKATGTGIPNTKVTLSADPPTKTITATADQRDGFFIFLQ